MRPATRNRSLHRQSGKGMVPAAPVQRRTVPTSRPGRKTLGRARVAARPGVRPGSRLRSAIAYGSRIPGPAVRNLAGTSRNARMSRAMSKTLPMPGRPRAIGMVEDVIFLPSAVGPRPVVYAPDRRR